MRRLVIVGLLIMSAVVALQAETFAVSVRLATEPTDDPRLQELLTFLEEGAMNELFAQGHIVFDIDPDSELQITRFQAIDAARIGGARYLLLLDAELEPSPGRGLVPGLVTVTVVDVGEESDRVTETIDATQLPRAQEKLADALALEVGALSVVNALREIQEVDTEW